MPNMSLKKVVMPEQEPDVRNKNFEEVALGYTKEMAMEEATRCLNCKHQPCKSGCPVGVPIPEFIQEVAAVILKNLIKLLQVKMLYRQFVDVFVLKKINVKVNVFVVLKVSQ